MTIAQISLFAARLLAGTGTFLVGVHLLTANIGQLATARRCSAAPPTSGW